MPQNSLQGIFKSKTWFFLESSPRRGEIKVWDLEMLLKVFGGSLGLLFGAPGGLLGALLVLLGRLDGTPNVSNILFGHP